MTGSAAARGFEDSVRASSPGRVGSIARCLGLAIGTGLLALPPVDSASTEIPGVWGQESALLDQAVYGSQLSPLVAGYQAGGTLGFTLRETAIVEQLYRRADGAGRGLVWSAQFVSRWPLTDDQLDRWSAQVIGLVADGLGADVRLAGWERLDAADIGERRVAYRYTLASADDAGEATVVVFAHGEQVGLTGAAAIGSRSPVSGLELAYLLGRQPRGSERGRWDAPRGPTGRVAQRWLDGGG